VAKVKVMANCRKKVWIKLGRKYSVGLDCFILSTILMCWRAIPHCGRSLCSFLLIYKKFLCIFEKFLVISQKFLPRISVCLFGFVDPKNNILTSITFKLLFFFILGYAYAYMLFLYYYIVSTQLPSIIMWSICIFS